MAMNDIEIPLATFIDRVSVQAEGEALGQAECGFCASSAKTEEEQEKYNRLQSSLRLDMDFTDSSIGFTYYFLDIPEGLEDEADYIIDICGMVFKPRVISAIEDQLELSDIKSKIADFVVPYIADTFQSTVEGGK